MKHRHTLLQTETQPRVGGFTLLEMMVATAVMAVLLAIVSSVTNEMTRGVRHSIGKADAFEAARNGFDLMTQELGKAVLNTYWDYYNASYKPRISVDSNFVPFRYGRISELHFLMREETGTNISLPGLTRPLECVGHSVFFQAPQILDLELPQQTLAAAGFFVAFGRDPSFPQLPSLNNTPRFRLMRWAQKPRELAVNSSGGLRVTGTSADWIDFTKDVYPIANNVISLVLRVPSTTARVADTYFWNSRQDWRGGAQPDQMHQLPSMVEITMIAIDESAAVRFHDNATSSADAYAALGLPSPTTLFRNPALYEEDLKKVKDKLAERAIKYEIFRTSIPLQSSRWSPNN